MPYNKKLVLGFMAQLLHPTGDVNIDFFPVNQGFWDSIVRLSSSHLVLTAFHGAIRRKKLENFVPKKLLSYSKEIADLNYSRNKEILNQILYISKLFKKNSIEHVFLKGSAMLISQPYPSLYERMLGDIDILVAKKYLKKAQKLLIDKGFCEVSSEFSFVEDIVFSQHLKRIVHPKFIAAVEIHSRLLADENFNPINSNDILKLKVKTHNGYWIPCKNHLWQHALFNWQHNDSGLRYNDFSLRSFMDVVHLEPENINQNFINNPTISHFYSLSSLFIKGYQNNNYISSILFKYKLIFPWFDSFSYFLTKSCITVGLIFTRLILIIKSKTYRQRLINNKKLLKKRIFIFLGKR